MTTSIDEVQDLTVLFIDIAGSTELYELIGDHAAQQRISSCQALIARIAHDFDGSILMVTGDEVLAAFNDPSRAVEAASEIHRRLAKRGFTVEVPLSVRIGGHVGSVLKRDGLWFGDTLNVCSRVVRAATAGQLIISGRLADRLKPTLKAKTYEVDHVKVKGKTKPMGLFQVVWESQDATSISAEPFGRRVYTTRLELIHASKRYTLSFQAPFSIGRSSECDLVVPSSAASRHHLSIDYQHGNFELHDHSTNGTFVAFESGSPLFLRHQHWTLRGSGSLFLGQPPEVETKHEIRFRC